MTDESRISNVDWDGPDGSMVAGDIGADLTVEVFCYDGTDEVSVFMPHEEFQVWASTLLAEIALREREG